MNKRLFINRIKNKQTLFLILGTFFLFILIFCLIKNDFFYNAIQYFNYYLDYYVSKYLNGNINDLIINNKYLFYIESDVQNIFSSLYLYVASFGNILFKIYMFLIPILIFYKVNKLMYDEIYNKYCLSQITRSSKKKYINKTMIIELSHSILIMLIPKILYFGILCIFFPIGISYNHAIVDALFISEPFLYNGYVINPIILILIDILMTIFSAMIISLISIFITCFFTNKSLSYLMFVTTTLIISLSMYLVGIVPFIYYTSIYSYFSMGLSSSIWQTFILVLVQFLLWLAVAKITLKRKIEKIL